MYVTLCEYATLHPDGTATLLRSGIDIFSSEEAPILVRVVAYIEVPPGALSVGDNPITTEVFGPNGETVFRSESTFTAEKVEGYARLRAPLIGACPTFGEGRVRIKAGSAVAERAIHFRKGGPIIMAGGGR